MTSLNVLKGGAILTLGNGFSAFASFLRNIIIARFISVEDFGIAALFALAMSAIEMASNLAIDKVIIQNSGGDEVSFQSSGHSFLLIRGLISSFILFFIAPFLANMFNIPQATWAFQILAVVPAIKGFLHLDAARFQRKMNFYPIAWIETLPQFLILILSWPLVVWLETYEVVIWLIIIQTVTHVVLSHVFAVRKYQLGWDVDCLKTIYKFGWPLLVNGILMFAILQGDKAIVGAAYSMETLGWYSAAFILTLAPAMIINKVIYSLMLPWVSNVKQEPALLKKRSMLIINTCIMIGLLLSIFFSLLGELLLISLFGINYSLGGEIVALLGFMQFIRIAKAGPMIIAMGLGDTKNPMISNSIRGIAFILAMVFAWAEFQIIYIVIIGIVGEIASFVISSFLLSKSIKTQFFTYLKPAIIVFMLGFGVMYYSSFRVDSEKEALYTIMHILISIVAVHLSALVMPALKFNVYNFVIAKSRQLF